MEGLFDGDGRVKSTTARDTTTASQPDDNYGPQFLATIWILTGSATIFLALRIYCKLYGHKRLWWDDHIITAAWVCLMIQTILLTVLVPMGFAQHSWVVKNWQTYLIVANTCGVFSITAAAWSKTSFAITLLRISQGPVRQVIWFIIITVNLFLGLSGLFTWIHCSPIEKIWNGNVNGTCWPDNVTVTFNSFSSAWSGGMDIALATLPWFIIRSPLLNRKERTGVSIAMSMGVFAGLTSIGKIVTLYAMTDPDPIAGVPMMILATAEIAITIMAASIPVLRVLIRKNLPSNPSLHFYRSYRGSTSHDDGPESSTRASGGGHSRSGSKVADSIAELRLPISGIRHAQNVEPGEKRGRWPLSEDGHVGAGLRDLEPAMTVQSDEVHSVTPMSFEFRHHGAGDDIEGAWLGTDSE